MSKSHWEDLIPHRASKKFPPEQSACSSTAHKNVEQRFEVDFSRQRLSIDSFYRSGTIVRGTVPWCGGGEKEMLLTNRGDVRILPPLAGVKVSIVGAEPIVGANFSKLHGCHCRFVDSIVLDRERWPVQLGGGRIDATCCKGEKGGQNYYRSKCEVTSGQAFLSACSWSRDKWICALQRCKSSLRDSSGCVQDPVGDLYHIPQS
jgi:hypothetical protein